MSKAEMGEFEFPSDDDDSSECEEFYEWARDEALADLEMKPDRAVASPLANQKKEELEGDRAVATNMSPLANQEKEELKDVATDMGPLANLEKEKLKECEEDDHSACDEFVGILETEYTAPEFDLERFKEEFEMYNKNNGARRRAIIEFYERARDEALANLEMEDDRAVASPLANQKKEELEADRAVATNMSPLANQEKEELKDVATDMGPLANQEKEKLKAVGSDMDPRADERRGIKRKLE